MSSIHNYIAAHRNVNTRIKFNGLGIATFLCGATASINLNIVGQVYMAELLIIILALGIIIFKGDNGVIANRSFHMFMLFGLITLAGYMITDIVIGAGASQYLRGWGRVGFLLTNIMCLMLIAGQGRQYLWWFILGMGVGGVVYLALTGLPWTIWKLGYGERVSFIVLAMSCILPRRMALMLLLGFGILNIALDYRNFAAVYILVAGIIWARSKKAMPQIKDIKGYFIVGSVLVLAMIVLVIGFTITEEKYGARRADSNIGRLTGIIVSIRAIADSPIIGYGSWTVSEEHARMLREEQQKRFDKSRARRAPDYRAKVFRSHSQILQSWIEAGIFGAAFFFYYGYRLVQGSKRYIMDRPIDRFSAINIYFVILGVWHLIASPFGGDQRILIAITVAILTAIEFDNSKKIMPTNTPYDDNRKNAIKDKRILSRRENQRDIHF